MTQTNRIDATFDTLASVGKTVTNGYYNTFFSPEASERYQRIGEDIGTAIGETLERFELEAPVREFFNQFQSSENLTIDNEPEEEMTDYMDEDE